MTWLQISTLDKEFLHVWSQKLTLYRILFLLKFVSCPFSDFSSTGQKLTYVCLQPIWHARLRHDSFGSDLNDGFRRFVQLTLSNTSTLAD
jgi:hypothetical protein